MNSVLKLRVCYFSYFTLIILLLCSDSHNDVPPVPQRNVSIAAERGAVRPSTFTLITEGALIIYFPRKKRQGALIGAGALNGANTVLNNNNQV